MAQVANADIRKRFDALDRAIAELRQMVLGDEAHDEDPEGWKRLVRFLGAFYHSPGMKLTRSQVSKAAREAGYDPRGTAGFYVGNGSLRAEGDWRILTDVGRKLYEEHRHLLDGTTP